MTPIAIISTSALALGFAGFAVAPANASSNDVAEAEGQLLTGGGTLNLNTIAELEAAYSASAKASTTASTSGPSSVDLSLLNTDSTGLPLNLGSLQLPAGELGSIITGGALDQYATTDTTGASYAASGTLTASGAIDTNAASDSTGDASIDLTPLVASDGLTSSIIQGLDLDLGAVAASATGTPGSPVTYAGAYQIAGAKLTAQSSAISGLDSDLVGLLGTGNTGLTATLNSLLGSSSVLSTLEGTLSGVTTTLSNNLGGLVTATLTPNISVNSTDLSSVIPQTIESDGKDGTPQGTVSIDLANGTISVDLGKLLSAETGNTNGTLNGLPANYAPLQGSTIQNALAGAINDALTSAISTIQTNLNTALSNVTVTIGLTGNVALVGVPIANINISDVGTLAELVNGDYSAFTVSDTSTALGLIPIGSITGPIETGLLDDLLPAVGGLVQTQVSSLTSNIASAGTSLGSALGSSTSGLLAIVNQLVNVVVNVQPTNATPPQAATFTTPGAGIATPGDAGFTERAIEINVLPNVGAASSAASIALASASVESTVTGATVTASDDTPAPGETVTFSGTGFTAGSTVTLTFVDASGATIGSTTATANSNGSFTAGGGITVPSTDTNLDQISVTASDTSGHTANTTLQVSDSSGTSTSGTATSGTSTSGTATSGTSTSGTATSGTSTSGTATSGTSTSGTATSGTATSGTATSGTATSGTATSGTATSGTATSGTATSGSSTTSGAVSGKVSIVGTKQVGGTLVADPSGWSPSDTTVTYVWKVGGTVIGTGQTLIVPSSAAGKTITLTATGTAPGYTSGTATATAAIPTPGSKPKVERIAGPDRYGTAVAIAKDTFPVAGSAKVVFVATGQNFPDALAAGPAAAKMDGPLLLTQTASLNSGTAAEIKFLKPAEVIIVGQQNAVSNAVEAAIKKIVPNTVRWGGADRYATSLIIAKNAFKTASSAFVATGVTFPDALSASAYAGSKLFPVVLVNGESGSLPSGLGSYLKSAKISSLKIAGGTAAISTGEAGELKSATGLTPTRYAGADRYETSIAINTEFTSGPLAYLATGANFPDALAGAAAAAKNGAPLYVVRPTCVPSEVLSQFSAWKTGTVKVLGGPAALNADVADLKSC